MGELGVVKLLHNRGGVVFIICVFLLWIMALRGKTMSLPGVFGGVIYVMPDGGKTCEGLLREGLAVFPSFIVPLPGVAGALSELLLIHKLLSSLPGVLGISSYNGYEADRRSKGAGRSSLLAEEGEKTSSDSALASSTTIPLPGVGGRSTSSTPGDVGLLFVRMSGSLSTKQPVGVGGLRLSTFSKTSDVHLGLPISTSSSGSSAATTVKQ